MEFKQLFCFMMIFCLIIVVFYCLFCLGSCGNLSNNQGRVK